MQQAPGGRAVPSFTGDTAPEDLGTTLIHEHIFVGDPELDVNFPHPEWDEEASVEAAAAGLEQLHSLGVRTVVDLTVPGLGRNAARVAAVAARSRVRLVASTGYYTAAGLPLFFQTNRPGGLVDVEDPLEEMFLRDLREGIAGTGVRAGMLKVYSDARGITEHEHRVFAAAASAQLQTGVPITTHSDPSTRGGLEQQQLLRLLGVQLDRVVIGHAGDSGDLDYLMALADAGSTVGFDRFGMEHTASDEQRVGTLLALLDRGYADRIVLSHDAAFFSRVTPPSWRARKAPHWHMGNLHTRILPQLRARGVTEAVLAQMLVENPRRLLSGQSDSRTKNKVAA